MATGCALDADVIDRRMTMHDFLKQPMLRPVETYPVSDAEDSDFSVYDASGMSEVVITMTQATMHVLALMDGTNSLDEIREAYSRELEPPLTAQALNDLVQTLDENLFLYGDKFERHCADLVERYRAAKLRPMPSAEELGIVGDARPLFEDMLGAAKPRLQRGEIRGLVAPHLDYPRGRPCYGSAYAALSGSSPPDRVVILGTNHFGRATSVVGTASDFVTPLGTTRNDNGLLERLEKKLGDLREFELDHACEHSIELQVAWLQHLFGADQFEIVPFLCPDPTGPTGTLPYDGNGVCLNKFAVTLGRLIEQDSRKTLIVAGADLSHVGQEFGDDPLLDESFLQSIERSDREALDLLEAGEPEEFVEFLAKQDNPTRICSAGCLYVQGVALNGCTTAVLDYHQSVDQETQTCVTCAAAVLT